MLSAKDAKTILRPSRILVTACQNETVRKSKNQSVFLTTIGLQGCVAVLIYDQVGNASLTHVDDETDLSFITDEIQFMEGEFKIDLIKKPFISNLDQKIKAKIATLDLEHCRTTFKNRVGESEDGTVMFNHLINKPQVFKLQDFTEIALPKQTISEGNKFKNDTVQKSEDAPELWQLRIYTRQLNLALSNNPCIKPLVTHDHSGWQHTTLHLEDEVEEKINNTSNGNFRFFSSGKQLVFSYVYPKYLALKEEIMKKYPLFGYRESL